MSTAALTLMLAVGLGGMAVVLNHCYARLALVELALNEGLPPGHQPTAVVAGRFTSTVDPGSILPPGIHVFLSRNCHACQRLVDELDQTELIHDTQMHLHYIDRPRPIAASAADRQQAELHADQGEIAAQLGADPLPYSIVIGDHDLVSRAVTPSVAQLLVAARDAGVSIEAAVTT